MIPRGSSGHWSLCSVLATSTSRSSTSSGRFESSLISSRTVIWWTPRWWLPSSGGGNHPPRRPPAKAGQRFGLRVQLIEEAVVFLDADQFQKRVGEPFQFQPRSPLLVVLWPAARCRVQ